jgi:PEP-CTERM motif
LNQGNFKHLKHYRPYRYFKIPPYFELKPHGRRDIIETTVSVPIVILEILGVKHQVAFKQTADAPMRMRSLGLILSLAVLGTAFFALPTKAATIVTNAAALGSIDTINFSQLGLPNTPPLSSPQTVVSGGSVDASLSSATSFQTAVQGNNWFGNFTQGDALVTTGLSGGPNLTLTFATAVSAVGAQIQPGFNGDFTGTITAYGASGTVLGSFSENGFSNNAADGSAIFLGIMDPTADIWKVTYTTSDVTAPNYFALGTVDFSEAEVAAVPEPSTWAMMIIGFSFIGFVGLRRKTGNRAVGATCAPRRILSSAFGLLTAALATTAPAENSRQTLSWQPYDDKDVLTDKVTHEVGSEVTFPDGNMVQAFAKCGQDAVRQKYPGLTIVVGAFQAGNRQSKPFAWQNKAIQVPLLLNDQRRPDVHSYTEDPRANFIAVGFYDPASAKRYARLDEAPMMKLEALRGIAEMKQEVAWDNFVAGTGGTLADLLQATSIRLQLPLVDASADAVEINPQDLVLKTYVQACNAGLLTKSGAR